MTIFVAIIMKNFQLLTILEHEIWSNQNLCFRDVIIYIWIQNK